MTPIYEASTSLATFLVNRLLESPSITPQRLLTACDLLLGAHLMAHHMGTDWMETFPLSQASIELERLAREGQNPVHWLDGKEVDYTSALRALLTKVEGDRD